MEVAFSVFLHVKDISFYMSKMLAVILAHERHLKTKHLEKHGTKNTVKKPRRKLRLTALLKIFWSHEPINPLSHPTGFVVPSRAC